MTIDGNPAGSERLFVHNFVLDGTEVPGWRLERGRLVQAPEGPPIRRTFWRTGEKNDADAPDAPVLAVEVIECRSAKEAHETLASLVGDYQSPYLSKVADAPFGDESFVLTGGTAVVFARGNVVLQVRNASGEVVAVTDAARALDAAVHRRPEVGGAVVPSLDRPLLRTAELAVGDATEVTVKATAPAGGPVTLRYYSRLGDVTVVDGVTLYQAVTAGEEHLVVVATSSSGGSAEVSVDLVVSS